jgi:agmatine deiminase
VVVNSSTPSALGYRWPAEWEPHAATWLAWPHNPDTWPGHLERARAGFIHSVAALHGRERVCILVADEIEEEKARCRLENAGVTIDAGILFPHVPTDDAWLRDSGPIFVIRNEEAGRTRAVIDFPFDAWGGKYPPWQNDAAVPAQIAEYAGVERFCADFVLEGGAVDGNGRGTVLTTESCLLHPNREMGRTRESMEARLHDWLGATQVLWLGAGIAGDDTDGHVDDIARFVDVGTVVVAGADPDDAANHGALAENLNRLKNMRDQDGKLLVSVELPPPPVHRIDGLRCPASYANFYVANGAVLVPTFGVRADARALAILGEMWPEREVVGIPCETLVLGLGGVHCLSQQEPSAET